MVRLASRRETTCIARSISSTIPRHLRTSHRLRPLTLTTTLQPSSHSLLLLAVHLTMVQRRLNDSPLLALQRRHLPRSPLAIELLKLGGGGSAP